MCIQAARATAGAGVAFVGLGLPVLTTTLTRVHHDRALIFNTEVGVMDWDPPLAEVDRYGNLNALMIGEDRLFPEKRLRGSGGNTDAACLAPRVLTVMSLEPRRFVERVSFLTSPGYIDGPGARAAAGLEPQGPNLVVSTMGVFDFDTPDGGETGSCELRLTKVFPGIEPEVIDAMLPWPLLVSDDLERVEAPSGEELRVSVAEGRY